MTQSLLYGPALLQGLQLAAAQQLVRDRGAELEARELQVRQLQVGLLVVAGFFSARGAQHAACACCVPASGDSPCWTSLASQGDMPSQSAEQK